MKEYKYGVETLTKEEFLWIRKSARKQLADLNAEIRRLKGNRKLALATEFLQNNPDYNKTYFASDASGIISYHIYNMKYELRKLHIVLGLLKGTPYEKMEPTTKEPFVEGELKRLIADWRKNYEKFGE